MQIFVVMQNRVFISSVQREFAEERRRLVDYIRQDVPFGHSLEPTSPILAHPMCLAGFIERLGTGTNDLIDACTEMGLKKPTFVQEEDFCITIWRNVDDVVSEYPQEDDSASISIVAETTGRTTTETTTEILSLLTENPYMTL